MNGPVPFGIERKCPELDVEIEIVTYAAAAHLGMAKRDLSTGSLIGGRVNLEVAMRHLHSVTLPECPFEGNVEATTQAGAIVWDCPVCYATHRED